MWIIPPLLPGASRADREWHRREVVLAEREIKDIWTNVCLVTRLAQVIPPPGAILQTPVVGSITLDSVPARFAVKLRPGQLPIDFAKHTERFAAAFRVPDVEVATLTWDKQWISIRLLEPFWIEFPDEYVLEPVAEDEPQPALPADTADDDRVPDRGPRSLRGRRHRSTAPRGEGPDPSPETDPIPDPGTVTTVGSVRRFFGDFWRLPDPGARA